MEMEGGCSRDGGGGGRGLRVFFPTAGEEEREHMFDKTVTPSDVGKLNRLVIPKQHAERYFPLDSSSSEKGLLLNFEDRDGKEWRFRYSYWNSSQSYVMTKGWSRFVKEKHLDAGDTVSFSRGMGEAARHRLFIDWKRRPADPLDRARFAFAFASPARAAFMPWGRLLPPPQPPASLYDHLHHQQRHLNYGYTPYPYHLRPPPLTAAASQVPAVQYGGGSSSSGSHAGLDMEREGLERAVFNPLLPEPHAKSGVRLFGVNLDHPHLELSLGGSTSSPDAQGSVLRRSGKQPETNYPGR